MRFKVRHLMLAVAAEACLCAAARPAGDHAALVVGYINLVAALGWFQVRRRPPEYGLGPVLLDVAIQAAVILLACMVVGGILL